MQLSLPQVKDILAVRESVPDVLITGWSIDSRTTQPGDLFFAIKGDHFDGHQFLGAAFEKGAVAAVVSEAAGLEKPLLTVESSVSALGKLAWAVRESWVKPVIGVTGSAGKTSTKDLIATFLSIRYRVGKTVGNFNNHIGLPLSLLRIPQDADLAVLEMGMNHSGEIRALAQIAKPQIGVVTNVGYAHIEAFSSIDGVAAAKRELIESLPPDGVAVLNADDERVLNFREHHAGRVVTYGFGENAEIRADDLRRDPQGSSFRVGNAEFRTSLPGQHAVSNILAGIAVAGVFGIPPAELVEAVAALTPGKMRGSRREVRGITILDDSYNANPEAMRSMINVLAEESAQRKIAVLGEMLELGDWSERLHRDIGVYAAEHGIDVVIGVQGAARYLAEAAHGKFFADARSAGEFLRDFAQPGDAVLFKGSRATHVEEALATMEG